MRVYAHAHARETKLRAEISPHVLARASRSAHGATFRGTHKFEALAGTKFDVPAVSALPDIPIEHTALVLA